MRFFSSLLLLCVGLSLISCKNYERQQYTYSYRAPVHAEKQAPAPAPSPAADQAQGAASKPAQ